MIEEGTTGKLDFEALRHAFERRDPELLLGFYADGAELRVVNADAPEGSPAFELRGKAEIEKYLRAVPEHDTTGRVESEVVGEDRAAFSEAREYPDGSRVVIRTA